MNYHNITKDDMLNGEGLRVVLWVAGCDHHCIGCQNPETHKHDSGIFFDKPAWEEIKEQLEKPYISGITFSGGDPLCECNRETISELINTIRELYPNKTIWLYTGYTWEEIEQDTYLFNIVKNVNVLCEGKFILSLISPNKHWVGSSNQRVIDIPKTLATGTISEYIDK